MGQTMQAQVSRGQAPRDASPTTRLTVVHDTTPVPVDDSGQGLALFALFTTAVLVVTGAVAFLALLTSWWVLGLVFGVHVLATVIVGTAIFRVLSRKPAITSDAPAPAGATSLADTPRMPVAAGQTSSIAP